MKWLTKLLTKCKFRRNKNTNPAFDKATGWHLYFMLKSEQAIMSSLLALGTKDYFKHTNEFVGQYLKLIEATYTVEEIEEARSKLDMSSF